MTGAVGWLYDRLLRPYLPRKIGIFNGVLARVPRALDRTDVVPDYKDGFLSAVESAVTPGDEVVIVGAGYAISTVVAARAAGPQGHVTVYEAAAEWADRLPETLELNAIPPERVAVEHAMVGAMGVVDGDKSGAAHVSPADLPDCDVLELDCEGGEVDIIERLGPRPDWIVVETHPRCGTPTSSVESALEGHHYAVEHVGTDAESGDALCGTARRATHGE